MAKCPGCSLLVPHGAMRCTCGTSLVLVTEPRAVAWLAGFAALVFTVTFGLCRVVFALLAK